MEENTEFIIFVNSERVNGGKLLEDRLIEFPVGLTSRIELCYFLYNFI